MKTIVILLMVAFAVVVLAPAPAVAGGAGAAVVGGVAGGLLGYLLTQGGMTVYVESHTTYHAPPLWRHGRIYCPFGYRPGWGCNPPPGAYYNPPPVYYAPAPVYTPPPVYYQPPQPTWVPGHWEYR